MLVEAYNMYNNLRVGGLTQGLNKLQDKGYEVAFKEANILYQRQTSRLIIPVELSNKGEKSQ